MDTRSRILYVTPYVPSPIRVRPYNLIRSLVRMGSEVTLVAAASTAPEDDERAETLRGWGVDTECFPVPLGRTVVNCARALPSREPMQAVYSYCPSMTRRIAELSQSGRFDVVHVEHLRAARHRRSAGDLPLVYDAVDCISLLFEQASSATSQLHSRLVTRFELGRTRRYEAELLTKVDCLAVTSPRDREALLHLAETHLSEAARRGIAPVRVVTNGVDLEYFQPDEAVPDRDLRTIVFSGKMSYHANVTAARHFATQVMPIVWARQSDVRFRIVGKDPPKAIRDLAADERIEVTGTVADLRPHLAQAGVSVCPAPYSVGVQNKVLEAMAMATPVVCSPAALNALEAHDGSAVLTAEDPHEFAAQTMRILSDPLLAATIGTAGRVYVEEHHSWDSSARRLVECYEVARDRHPL